jgi:hypothetical protein
MSVVRPSDQNLSGLNVFSFFSMLFAQLFDKLHLTSQAKYFFSSQEAAINFGSSNHLGVLVWCLSTYARIVATHTAIFPALSYHIYNFTTLIFKTACRGANIQF